MIQSQLGHPLGMQGLDGDSRGPFNLGTASSGQAQIEQVDLGGVGIDSDAIYSAKDRETQ